MDPIIEMVKEYEECWSQTNAADMPKYFVEGGTYTPRVKGRAGEAIAAYADAVFKAFPDSKMPITRIIREGNHLCAEWVYRATMTGDYGPMQAAGEVLDFVGCHLIEVEGDKLKSVISRWDRLDMLQQVGLA